MGYRRMLRIGVAKRENNVTHRVRAAGGGYLPRSGDRDGRLVNMLHPSAVATGTWSSARRECWIAPRASRPGAPSHLASSTTARRRWRRRFGSGEPRLPTVRNLTGDG